MTCAGGCWDRWSWIVEKSPDNVEQIEVYALEKKKLEEKKLQREEKAKAMAEARAGAEKAKAEKIARAQEQAEAAQQAKEVKKAREKAVADAKALRRRRNRLKIYKRQRSGKNRWRSSSGIGEGASSVHQRHRTNAAG